MKINRMMAVHEIYRSSGQYKATGELDAKGEPVLFSISEIIPPRSFFTPRSEAEARELLSAGACRPVERGEEARARAAEGEDRDEEMPLDLPMAARPGPSPVDAVAEDAAEAEDDA